MSARVVRLLGITVSVLILGGGATACGSGTDATSGGGGDSGVLTVDSVCTDFTGSNSAAQQGVGAKLYSAKTGHDASAAQLEDLLAQIASACNIQTTSTLTQVVAGLNLGS